MTEPKGRKTERAHWDAAWESPVRARLPSRLNIDVHNITSLLRKHVWPGAHYIEIGCAPGKLLAWVSHRCRARAAGLDYSESGVRQCEALFSALALAIDLYHVDFFDSVLPKGTFDVVTSFGFVEHFDDPRDAVARHVELLRPGGTALIGVPNYGGVYGYLQGWCDPANLAIHNLKIMRSASLAALVGSDQARVVTAYRYGRASLWLVNLDRKLPRRLARAIQLFANFLGLLQVFPVQALAPMLVLEIHK